MKKLIIGILLLFCALCGLIGYFYCDKTNDNNLKTIKVAEVTHSIFYTPWYVAIEKGYFKDEGLDIDLIMTPGADKVAASVLSNDVNIGFAGAEATLYVYNNGEKDYLESFAGLTKRDGQFIVGSCSEKSNFNLNNLKGKEVLGGRTGGMPLMNFMYALKNEGIKKDELNINTSIDFASLSGAYIGGTGDYVNLFEPNALKLEKENFGCVLGSVGKYAGEVPYTVFMARKSYISDNEKTIKSFTKALNKGIEYVSNNDSNTIANTIYNQFPDNTKNEISAIVKRYKNADSWWDNTYIKKDAYNRLIDIMKYNNALDKEVSYDILVNNKYNE